MNHPSSPTRDQVIQLKEAANATIISYDKADGESNYHFNKTLQPWSFKAIREL